MVALGNYSGAQELPGSHAGGPWIEKVVGESNLFYEAHYYPHAAHSGANFDTYASEVTKASSFTGQGAFTRLI